MQLCLHNSYTSAWSDGSKYSHLLIMSFLHEISLSNIGRYAVPLFLLNDYCISLQHALSGNARIMPFDPKTTCKQECLITTFQDVYFMSDSFEQAKVKMR